MAARSPTASRTKPSWHWAVAGSVLGLLVALLLFAPAQWLADAVRERSGGQILLREARGTVWNGSARLVLTGGPDSADAAALPTRIDWRLRPRWNGVRADVSTACCTSRPITVRSALQWGGVDLEVGDGQSRWPAGLLAGLGTPWNTLQLEGDLRLDTKDLSVEWVAGRLQVSGQAVLTAQRISSRLSTLRPMGSYRITLLGGPTPSLRLETVEGALQLSGSGSWVGSRLRFAGEASAAPERESALSNLLNIIGRRAGPRSIITIG